MCTCTTTPCKYTGVNLDTLGIKTNDSIEESFKAVEDFVVGLATPSNPNEQVKYTESTLGSGSVGNTAYAIVANTTYKVISGYDGKFEVNYVGQVNFSAAGNIYVRLIKNGVAYSSTAVRRLKSGASTYQQLSFFVSDIDLVAEDEIKIQAYSDDNTQIFLENCILKITRL